MLLEKPCHKTLQVPDSPVVVSVVGDFSRGVAEPRPSRRVYVQHMCCFGPAVGVRVELYVLQRRLTAGRLCSCEEGTKGKSTGHNKSQDIRRVSSDAAEGFLGVLGSTSWA
jgi:hypothetical protein